jgi:plastocyanin/uncharacterized membrane protein YozB (DUF420 family)
MEGFLGFGGTFRADLNLTVQLLMGLALLTGMVLARRKKFRAHGFCQASVMILNLAMIFLIMAPSFHRQVEPHIPARLGDNFYLIATIHTTIGTIAELLGLYIVLVAGTNIMPEKLRFKRYKPWMRTALALWWIVILLGVGTYYFWYISAAPQQPKTVEKPVESQPKKVVIKVTNFQFDPKEITIEAGTTVEWIDEMGRHTVEADDSSFQSDVLLKDGRFERTYDQPGVFPYYCSLHGDKGGVDMSGVIRVVPRPQ